MCLQLINGQVCHIMSKVGVDFDLNMEDPFTKGKVTTLVGIPSSAVLLFPNKIYFSLTDFQRSI